MKGKKLYHLLNALGKNEKKNLKYHLSLSRDKRDSFLSKISKYEFESLEALNQKLSLVLKEELSTKTEVEKDKTLRRFVDYASRKIEDLKILDFLKKNGNERIRLLNLIADEENLDFLQNHYVLKAEIIAEKNKDLLLKNQTLDWQLSIFGREQKEKNFNKIKKLLKEKKLQLNNINHEQLSFFYRLLSNLYLEDIRISDEELKIDPNEKVLDQLSEDCIDKKYAVDYLITKARFAFFDEDNVGQYLEDAENLLNTINLEENERHLLTRRFYFLKLAVGFNNNFSLEQLSQYAKIVTDYNLKFQFRDGFSFFYYLMILTLDDKLEEARRIKEEYATFFFTKSTLFYSEFIDALFLLKIGNKEKQFDALVIFSKLKYSPNYYISLFSSLFEFCIYYKSDNYLLCKSLVERLKSYLYQNQQRKYTYKASVYTYNLFRSALSKRTLKKKKPTLTPLHNYIIEMLE